MWDFFFVWIIIQYLSWCCLFHLCKQQSDLLQQSTEGSHYVESSHPALVPMGWVTKWGKRKLCFMGQLRLFVTGSVRWRVWVQPAVWLNVGVYSSTRNRGNKSCLYLKKTNDPPVLKLSLGEVFEAVDLVPCLLYVLWFNPTWGDCFHFPLCLMWSCGTERSMMYVLTARERLKVPVCAALIVWKSVCVHYFVSFVNAEVIVTLKCVQTACIQSSAPFDYKGIQALQTWHTGLREGGPPHESI